MTTPYQTLDWATDRAAGVTCCAGPQCCEDRIAQELRRIRVEALEEAANVAQNLETTGSARLLKRWHQAAQAIRALAERGPGV